MEGHRGSRGKRGTILEAARELFLRDGFTATSVDAITELAGVSKATVYAHFSSKENLFTTLVRETSTTILERFPGLAPGGDVEQELVRYLVALRGFGFSDASRWERLGIAEATRHPTVARTLWENGPLRVQAALSEFLTQAGCREPTRAAQHLVAITLLAPMYRVLMGVLDPATADPEENLREDIQAVLRAYPPGQATLQK